MPLGWLGRAKLVSEQVFAGQGGAFFVSEGVWLGGYGVEVGVLQCGKAEQSPLGTMYCRFQRLLSLPAPLPGEKALVPWSWHPGKASTGEMSGCWFCRMGGSGQHPSEGRAVPGGKGYREVGFRALLNCRCWYL